MKKINRKEFFAKALAGIAAINLAAKKIGSPVQGVQDSGKLAADRHNGKSGLFWRSQNK